MAEFQSLGGMNRRYRHRAGVQAIGAQRFNAQRLRLPTGIGADTIREAQLLQGRRHQSLLRIQPGQHRAVRRLGTFPHHCAQTGRRASSLIPITRIPQRGHPRTRPLIPARPQLDISGTLRAGGEHAIRIANHRGGRTIIDIQGYVGCQRTEFLAERTQIIAGGSGEGINGLRGITHHAHLAIAPVPHPQTHQPMLQGGHILIFVHSQPSDTTTDGGSSLFKLGILQQMAHHQQNIVEVYLVAGGFITLICRYQIGHAVGVQTGRRLTMRGGADLGVITRRNQRHLGPIDFRLQVTHGKRIGSLCTGHTLKRRRDKPLVVGDQIGERRLGDAGPDSVELVQRRRMECGRRHTLHAQPGDAGAHLLCRLDRKRYGQHARGIPIATSAGVGDAARDRTRLARAGPRYDAHRPVNGSRRLALCVIKRVKDVFRLIIHTHHCVSFPGGNRRNRTKPRAASDKTDERGHAVSQRADRFHALAGRCVLVLERDVF